MNTSRINAAASRNYGINVRNRRYIQTRNNVIRKSSAEQLQYPLNIARKINRLMNTKNNKKQENNVNRAYKRLYGINSQYRAKKYAILKQLNSLPVWNTRRHFILRNPNKVAYMIRIGQIK